VKRPRSSPLALVLRTYVHQDYDLRYSSVEAALRAFRDEASPAERRAVLDEIDALLARCPDDAALYAEMRKRGFVFYPPADGETTRAWLLRARGIIGS
jgi:hypothetical protein